MKSVVISVALCVVLAGLNGCAGAGIFEPTSSPASDSAANESVAAKADVQCSKTAKGQKFFILTDSGDEKLPRVKVGATGYGAPPKNYYPEGQRRLMTMRASKVDAYRALAEVVGGLHIWGGSSVGDMVLERDRFRSFIDTYVRGARTVSVSALEDGTYSTVVEMEVNQHFLSQVMAFVDPSANIECEEVIGDTLFSFYDLNNVTPTFYYSE